jgi:Tol biopolymer transport system component
MLRCDRSADGYRIAFNTGSDGTSVPDDSLHWFDLREPKKIYIPMAGLHVDEFTFSQDGERIAALGRANQSEPYGIYILEVPTGESKQIFSLEQGSSLTWSPDEEFLALVGSQEAGEEQVALMIHVRTGQVAFMAPLPEAGAALPSDWPMANWGVVFPTKMGGMAQCSTPPKP